MPIAMPLFDMSMMAWNKLEIILANPRHKDISLTVDACVRVAVAILCVSLSVTITCTAICVLVI